MTTAIAWLRQRLFARRAPLDGGNHARLSLHRPQRISVPLVHRAAARRDLERHQPRRLQGRRRLLGARCGCASASSCTASIPCPSAGGSIWLACSCWRRLSCRRRNLPRRSVATLAIAISLPPLGIVLHGMLGDQPEAGRDARMGRADADASTHRLRRPDRHPASTCWRSTPLALPLIRFISIVFIEFWRGVPIITVIFLASLLLPLVVPTGFDVDRLARAVIGLAFGLIAAYMAEAVQGGLQALARRPGRAACALELSYWRIQRMIVLLPGAAHRATGNHQRNHRPVQEHDPGADRVDLRPARHCPGRARRSGLGRHEHGGLRLRRRHLLDRLASGLSR